MAKRRGNLEGTYYKRPNGTWRVQVYHRGTRLSFSAPTKKECQIWLDETRKSLIAGASAKNLEIRISAFLKLWFKNKRGTVSANVYEQYVQVTRDYIIPEIGHLKMRDVTPLILIELYNKEMLNSRNKPLGWRSKKVIHSVLHQAFKDGVIWGYLVRNPANGISPPKARIGEFKVLSPHEASKLLTTARRQANPLYPFIYTALNTGMRLSELRGLQWSDINWETQTVLISKQIKRIKGGGFEFAPPKTASGKRKIELGQDTLRVLQEHREDQLLQKAFAGDQWVERNLIFTTNRGTPLQSTKVRKRFYKLLESAGLPRIRFHDLRHTAASLMLNNGIPVIVVSKRLGHSSVTVTLDNYAHFIPEMQAGIGNLMDDLIKPKK